jgi:L-asparaginase II
MKPFQAVRVAEEGVFAELGLGVEALALACASHHGTARHLKIVRTILTAAGVDEEKLACGAHRPMDKKAARVLDEAGHLPRRIHNNCSGKHAAMLAFSRFQGWPLEGYHQRSHPLQHAIREELARWIDPDPDALVWGSDGCGVPTPALSLEEMARAYSRFGSSGEVGSGRIIKAMTADPTLVSGDTAFSANIMLATRGRILGKEGAEGVFCLACPDDGWGAAFKVLDGAMRAIGPAVVHGLAGLALLGGSDMDRLGRFREPEIENTRGELVGRLRVVSELG